MPNRLRVAVGMAKTTQIAVAAATGIQASSLSDLINGNYTNGEAIQLGTARRLAEHFGCAIEDLFPLSARSRAAESAAPALPGEAENAPAATGEPAGEVAVVR